MKSVTIHPVVPDPEIAVTMTLKEAKALRDLLGNADIESILGNGVLENRQTADRLEELGE